MQEAARFTISLGEGRTADAIRVDASASPGAALAALDLPPHDGVVVLHGGAQPDPALTARITDLLAEGLALLAEHQRLIVADGGTDAGAFAAMGEARRRTDGSWSLIGVCPTDSVTYAGGPAPAEDRYPLEPHHSHFILVDGGGFGVESELLVGLATAGSQPGVALIVNGGEIVAREAQMHAVRGTPLIVVRGSGRTADELADPSSALSEQLPPIAHLDVVDLDDPAALAAALTRLLVEAE
ncbi:hypothetical protein [Aggregatilinea lenta]|uniref:hypothetical protein n=1 Tax=Aggregatilinea lenta TaxID=913108 RepID=UPI000E5A35C7|nr:hypothetical protein [Aggregatilinea lenta]